MELDTLNTEQAEAMAELLRPVADAIVALVKELAAAADAILRFARRLGRSFREAFARSHMTPKQLHIFLHTKKKRIRKKYEKKVMTMILDVLTAMKGG